MKVELIYDLNCPNTQMARTQLLRAFSEAEVEATWTEWDRASADSPNYVEPFGSPTILVNGKDVVPEPAAAASCCRLYVDRLGAATRVPPVDDIVSALQEASKVLDECKPMHTTRAFWTRTLAATPSVALALLPKLTCAACWPAYGALMSALGFGFFDYTAFLLPVTIAALIVTLVTLGWRAKTRQGYGPLAVGAIAAALHLAGRFALDSNTLTYAAVPILIGAAVWNAWPRMVATGACGSCAST